MPRYRIEGQVYEAENPTSAYVKHSAAQRGEISDPTEGMSGMDKFLAGAGSGMVNVGRQLGNILGVTDEETIREQEQTDAPLLDTGAGMAGRFVGEVAPALAIGGGAGAGARALGVGGRLAPMAIEGAAEGAVLAGPDDRLEGALTGGALGGGLTMLPAVGRRIAGGSRKIPEESRFLMEEGVDLMPGQAAPGGVSSFVEESMAGRMMPNVKEVRQQNIDDTVRAIMRRAAPTDEAKNAIQMGGKNISDDLDGLYNSFEGAYAPAKGIPVQSVSAAGDDLGVTMQRVISQAGTSDAIRQKVARYAQQEMSALGNKVRRGQMKSDHLLELRSRIRDRIRKRTKSPATDPDEVEALELLEDIVTRSIESQLPEEAITALRHADRKYSNYKVAENILAARTDKTITPSSISKAISDANKEQLTPSQIARGVDYNDLRPFAKAADVSLTEGTPKTGAALAVPILGGILGSSMGGPIGTAVGAGLPALPSAIAALGRPVRRAATGNTATQRALVKSLEEYQRLMQALGRAGRAGAVTYQQGEY
jgi:hypothetical protein